MLLMRSAKDATGRVVEKTAETKLKYRTRAKALVRRCAKYLSVAPENLPFEQFLEVIILQSTVYARRTIAFDRAALRFLADEYEATGVWSASSANWVRSRLADLKYDAAPPARTSAKKRKKISDEEIEKLLLELRSSPKSSDTLLVWLIAFGSMFPMRPVEWLSARIKGNVLVVKNAKHTNGRGHSPERIFPLIDLEKVERAELGKLLKTLSAVPNEADWARQLKQLSSRLTYICKKIDIKPLSFAGLRGIAIAILKRHRGARKAGYFSGHKSDRTSRTSYPHSSTAPKALKARVDATEEMLAVVQHSNRTPPVNINRASFKP